MDSRITQATLTYHDAVIGGLRGAGFSIAMSAHAMSLLDSYVHGFALQEASLPLDATGDIGAVTEDIMAQQQMTQAHPSLAEMAVTLVLQRGYACGNEFDFGIRLILDGLEAALDREPPEPS
jgi:2C-methyl-D-erythritol 2,4-cyclodiphosphate synthase